VGVARSGVYRPKPVAEGVMHRIDELHLELPFYGSRRGGRRRDFDGRTRPFHGQHFHRTAVALDQV
jgi:hypothetical protein